MTRRGVGRVRVGGVASECDDDGCGGHAFCREFGRSDCVCLGRCRAGALRGAVCDARRRTRWSSFAADAEAWALLRGRAVGREGVVLGGRGPLVCVQGGHTPRRGARAYGVRRRGCCVPWAGILRDVARCDRAGGPGGAKRRRSDEAAGVRRRISVYVIGELQRVLVAREPAAKLTRGLWYGALAGAVAGGHGSAVLAGQALGCDLHVVRAGRPQRGGAGAAAKAAAFVAASTGYRWPARPASQLARRGGLR
jgi:hypothetical protein